ncbi:hypothetical protein OG948_51320 (plasmid) [Embleya sp. NBC_00888]|uniref:hypothetical protein n=1 Tax=Embleya sp. NBC_00888 TaxID=2975960 RepID=UPI002F90826C|nr:hypothetical protein OG948_51320 [Embleya sp. NBC_00888]
MRHPEHGDEPRAVEDGGGGGDKADIGAAGAIGAADGEVAVARLALHDDDLPHAARHLADAMLGNPQLPELHEALAELCAKAGGPAAARELFPLDGEIYLGTLVCRAYVEAAIGDWDAAVGLIASAIGFDPTTPWTPAAWPAATEPAQLLDPDALAEAVSRAIASLPDPMSEEQRSVLRPFEQLVRSVAARHPDHVLLSVMTSALVRRMGDAVEAVRIAEHAHRIAPGYMPAVMLGNALRADGRPDRALAVWEAQLAREFDTHLAVDVAELYGATDRPAEGLNRLERVLATEPDHPTAAPARYGLRHRSDGDIAHLLGLFDHHRAHPDHDYALDLLARLGRRQPWLGMVHSAAEATVNLVQQVLSSPAENRSSELSCNVSRWEPPSSQLALRLAFPGSTVEYQSLAEPDPRLPLREVSTRVWEFDGLDPHPAVPAPSPSGAELIRVTTEIAWPTIPAAYDHAVRLAGLELADLLGALVHPPAPREDALGRELLAHQPELWIRGVQAFACLGIAHHRTDQPWAESERRRVLVDLLLGPEDWTTEAAGFALVAVAWTHPDTRDDIGALVLERLINVAESARHREVTILRSICALMLCCPWMDEHALRLARNLAERDRREADDASDQDERGPSDERDEGARSPTDDRTAKAGTGTDDAAPVAPSAPPAGSRSGRFKRLFGRQ